LSVEVRQAEFQPVTWKACWELIVSDRPAAEVAEELGMTRGAVYVAISRVLSRLRRELDGLME
jgi:RNA polymerase sigma-70 factor (ECF subfamily)